ncbi:ribonuclease H-like domain-containing protein [Tanacetum coccineum]
MSAKGEKIMGKSPVFIGQTGGAEDENEAKFKSKQRKPSFAKIEFVKSNKHVKTPRESIKKVENNKQAKYPRKNSQSPRAAVSVNTARPFNIAYPRPTVNSARTTSNVFNRAHSHVRRPFNKSTTNKNINLKEKVNTVKGNVTIAGPKAAVSDNKGNEANAGNPQLELQEKGVIDSGCSRHMIGNKSYLSDYKEIDGGFVAFGGDPKEGRITGKGKISTSKLDFEDMYFVKELKFNLFSVSQICDKKNSVLFTDTECVILSPDIKLLDKNHVLLRVHKKDNMYSVDFMNIVPSGGLTCLFAKATLDESNQWHRRFGHINFKTMNKLVRGNLVRGLPSKIFENNHTCVACQKGKQHKASCTKHALSFMRPFGCPVTILNTIDHLGKFDGKVDEGLFVGYSTNSKAFRVFNSKTRIIEENMHVKFSEDTPNIAGNGPNWLFDIDALTKSMNYEPVVAGNQSNGIVGIKECEMQDSPDAGFKPLGEEEKDAKDLENEDSEVPNTEEPRVNQEQDENVNNTNNINTVSLTVNAVNIENDVVDENIIYGCDDDPNMPNLEEIVYSDDDEGVDAKADMTNLDIHILVNPTPTTRIHKDHPLEQIIRDIHSTPQTRRMTKNVTDHAS